MQWFGYSLLNAFFHSISAALNKKGLQNLDVYSAIWAQSFFALFISFPITLFSGSFQSVGAVFWYALLTAAVFHSVGIIFYFKALKDSPISLVLPILSFTPVFLLITSPIILGEIPSFIGTVGILITVAGSYLLNLKKRSIGIFEPLLSIVKEKGTREMLFVAFLWSIAANFDKISINNANPILFSLSLFCAQLTIFSLIMLYRRSPLKPIFKNKGLYTLVGITIGLSNLFQSIAVSMTLVPYVSAMKRTSGLFGVFWGKIFFKEDNFKERLAGTVLMIFGIVLIVLS